MNTTRKKPTRDDLAKQNSRREVRRSTRRREAKEAGMTWNELHIRYENCKRAFIAINPLTALLKEPRVVGGLNLQQTHEVTKIMMRLRTDRDFYKVQLDKIYDKHRQYRGDEKDESLVLVSIGIGHLYIEWQNDFQTNVIDTVASTMKYIENALGANAQERPA